MLVTLFGCEDTDPVPISAYELSTLLPIKYHTQKYSRMLCSQSTWFISHPRNKQLNFNGTGAKPKVFFFSNDLSIPP